VIEAAFEYTTGALAVIGRYVARMNAGRIASAALLAGTFSLNEYTRAAYLGAGLSSLSNEVHGRLTAGLLPSNRGLFALEFLVVCCAIVAVTVALSALSDEIEAERV
jgi:ABC-type spermidine/putrescine transport system permease subunit II